MPNAHGGRDRRPVLVTGVPRSGTTWLARWLAGGRGMALAGREPMNPRAGQYALGGTLDGWARLTTLTGRQRRALVTAYRGLNPWVYSRYGARQWKAPWPGTRLVVKDPFALLSVPAVVAETRALPVVVYRHPAAVLASYRRMGWHPDLAELRAVLEPLGGSWSTALPADEAMGEAEGTEAMRQAEAMARFWAVLHDLALDDLDATRTDAVVVAHHEIAASGRAGGLRLAERLGVGWTGEMERELAKESGRDPLTEVSETQPHTVLHDFERPPAEVAEAWRSRLDPAEVALVERLTEETRRRVEERRFRLT
jgi:hypothetical protein